MPTSEIPMSARRRPLTPQRVLGVVLLVLILGFLLVPIVVVIPMSLGSERFLQFPPKNLTLKWYGEFFGDADWRAAALYSLTVASLTTIASVVIGTMAAVSLTRGTLAGKKILTAVTLAPLIVPHIVLGVALYLSFTPLGLSGNVPGLVLSHTALAVPFVVLTVSAALYRIDRSLEMAAMNLGASRFGAFRLVTLPLVKPAVAVGAVFAFLTSFDEAIVSFFMSGVSNKTLPRKLFENIDFDISPLIPAVSTVLMLVSLALMGGSTMLRRGGKREPNP
jgi:mannopine transport system permease protein